MIELNNVTYSYKTKEGHIKVLDDISLSIDEGEFVSFIGPSGCGKTTLIHLIGGLRPIQEGKLEINGVCCSESIEKHLYSIIFQEVTLLDWLTVKKNIELPVDINPKLKYVESEEILDSVGLLSYMNMYPHQLSGGMKARLGIGRSLMLNTPILLMDECFASLDEVTRENMNTFLLSILRKIKRTMIFVTHSIKEAVFMSDRVIVFSKKPSKIVDDIRIDIPRPRKLEDIENDNYTTYKKIVRKVLNKASS
ncbi:MAG: ABC transporter ATP-binding protein [Spirochaetota bacterium]